ncbi:hypothetical protein BDL97_15G052100 [Sphagnum fallax]|nr:hypothetical protein BDL97_15G052100 [Sphagnum fallax]KAH8939743.1 hypothetical protein BDL97_15G052100 [Sphagnum fallax]KAH8939744.1 hypothetical protein BDL97_15G052100 [Sphagnum fallax]
MGFPKHGRQQERRMPASYVMVTGAVFVAFFLVAVWVFSAPAKVPESETRSDVLKNVSPGDGDEIQVFEDATRDVRGTEEEDMGGGNRSEGGEEERLNAQEADEENSESTTSRDGSETKEEDSEQTADNAEENTEDQTEEEKVKEKLESLPADDLPLVGAGQADLTTENKESASSWTTQAQESKDEKDLTDSDTNSDSDDDLAKETTTDQAAATGAEEGKGEEEEEEQKVLDENVKTDIKGVQKWKTCSFKGVDAHAYIPCLDNKNYLDHLATRKHYEHRERHCPSEEDLPKCLVPLPAGYKPHIPWPASRNEVWYSNVPYDDLASYKADQNWVKKKSDKLEFPGGGTQFKNGVGQYIEYLERIWPEISWGKHTRVLLDVGCGVASFGGYLFDRNVLAMSFAPKDEHEAQVQMALERGIPAVSAVMGTQRLVYPSNVFDVVHCARCRVPWDADGGLLLLELNRILRPGGLFVWSATPVYQDDEINQKLWKDTIAVTESIAWKMLIRNSDPSTSIGAAIFQKPKDNKLYDSRKEESPPICHDNDNPDAAWYVRMTPCIHRIPTTAHSKWPAEWPMRLNNTPAWLSKSDKGLYGKTAPEDFEADALHWKRVVQKSYLGDLDIDWSTVRNIMDMKADYGGFAAALISQPVWVMNIVPINEPDTLPIIFDRGLIGMYHDWCEPHSTYPRSYDLLHANHLLGSISKTCKLENLLLEMDRILRPDGWAIFRDEVKVLNVVQEIVKSLHWDVKQMNTKKGEEILAVQKRFWRPHAST